MRHPKIILPSHKDIGFEIDLIIVNVLTPILINAEISRIDNFLEELTDQLENYQISQIDDSELIGNVLGDFKNKFIGCKIKCPLCRR